MVIPPNATALAVQMLTLKRQCKASKTHLGQEFDMDSAPDVGTPASYEWRVSGHVSQGARVLVLACHHQSFRTHGFRNMRPVRRF